MKLRSKIEEALTACSLKNPPKFEKLTAELTTFGTGGPCLALVQPGSVTELKSVITVCQDADIPVIPLGNGSNTLFSDEGFDGVILKLDGSFKEISMLEDGRLKVGSAVRNEKLANYCEKAGLRGAEFLGTVPGSIGGAAYMNAGAHGQDASMVIAGAECFNLENLGVERYSAEDIKFEYRKSVFHSWDSLVMFVYFLMSSGDPTEISSTKKHFVDLRKETQPFSQKTWGSVFKNPSGHSAGKLIEQCGLKGFSEGGAQISEMHANFVVNTGNATTQDAIALIKLMRLKVAEKFSIKLEPEVIIFDREGKKLQWD